MRLGGYFFGVPRPRWAGARGRGRECGARAPSAVYPAPQQSHSVDAASPRARGCITTLFESGDAVRLVRCPLHPLDGPRPTSHFFWPLVVQSDALRSARGRLPALAFGAHLLCVLSVKPTAHGRRGGGRLRRRRRGVRGRGRGRPDQRGQQAAGARERRAVLQSGGRHNSSS